MQNKSVKTIFVLAMIASAIYIGSNRATAMNDTWGYKSNDNNWKSSATIIRNLCGIASKGGNYLLNVGPTSEGLMPQPSLDRLAEVSQ